MWISTFKWWLPLTLPIASLGQECASLLERAQRAFDARQFPVAAAELQSALTAGTGSELEVSP